MGNDVGTSFEEWLRISEDLNTPEARAQRALFARAYTIAMEVFDLRDARGLSQSKAAKLAGVPRREVSRIERGSVYPDDPNLARLVEALGGDPDVIEQKGRAAAEEVLEPTDQSEQRTRP
jgi:transcriptional regulator with XRE-family HTH domain